MKTGAFTETVKTVAEFMAWVVKLPIDSYQGPYVYRGVSNKGWTPTSSLYREIIKDRGDPTNYQIYKNKVDALIKGAKDGLFDLSAENPPRNDLRLMANLQEKWYALKSQPLTERTKSQGSFFIFGWPESPDDLMGAGSLIIIYAQSKASILLRLKVCFGIEATTLLGKDSKWAAHRD